MTRACIRMMQLILGNRTKCAAENKRIHFNHHLIIHFLFSKNHKTIAYNKTKYKIILTCLKNVWTQIANQDAQRYVKATRCFTSSIAPVRTPAIGMMINCIT